MILLRFYRVLSILVSRGNRSAIGLLCIKFFLKVKTHWDQMESVISKIIYLFKLLKISMAYLATAVKTIFVVFLKFL